METETDKLKRLLRLFLDAIEDDPMAVQFFDLRLVEEAKAAV